MSDLRLALRALLAAPLVTCVVTLSLALGIGANAAIFALVDSLLLRTLPVPHAEQLAMLEPSDRGPWWPYAAWQAIRDRRQALGGDVAAYRGMRVNLAAGGPSDVVDGLLASGNYFDVAGVSAILGRAFGERDDQPGGGRDGPVVVLGHTFWQQRFGGAADVLGRTLVLDRVPFTIVGVMPPGFFGLEVGRTFDVAMPIETDVLIDGPRSFVNRRGSSAIRLVARLEPHRSLEAAEQAFRGMQPQIRELTRNPDAGALSQTLHFSQPFVVRAGATGASLIRERYRKPMLVIMAVVSLVLLVACANLANVFLARTTARRHELSVRLALGASRWRLARQVLVEILLLAAMGALAGLAVAHVGSRLLMRQLSTQMNVVFLDVQIDWRLVAFTALVAVASTLLAGLAPAWRAAGADPIEALRARGRGATPDQRIGVSGFLVVGQVALSLVLVAGAFLFLETFRALTTREVGFERNRVLIVALDAQGSSVEPQERGALFERVLDEVRRTPGVEHAALSTITPVSGMVTDFGVEVEHEPPPGEIVLVTPGVLPRNAAYFTVVTPGWFDTYGTRVLEGRDFDQRDRYGSTPVAIVNETFVRRLLPGRPAIGRRFRSAYSRSGTPNPWIEVVGVVRDAAYRGLRDELPSTFYVPLAQPRDRLEPGVPSTMRLSIRSSMEGPASLTRSVGQAIARVDRAIGSTFIPLTRQIDHSLVRERLLAIVAGFFGVLALLLAALGLYGVMSHAVGERRREIGIRMALGARAEEAARLIVGRTLRLVLCGVILGAAGALLAARSIETLLFGVTSKDPAPLAASALVLIAVGALAGWLPARRAARTDPARVLQAE
jgi:putative ABC transport system permease protein